MVKIPKTLKLREALLQLGLKYWGSEVVLPEISDIESYGGEVTWWCAKGMHQWAKNTVSAEDGVRKFSFLLSNGLNQPESNWLGNLSDIVYRGQPITISTSSTKQERKGQKIENRF